MFTDTEFSQQSPLHILVVEDSPTYAALIRSQLQSELTVANQIHVAERMVLALAYLREHVPDLILTDMHLPDSEGLNTFLKLYEAAPDVPIVILSGSVTHETAIAAVRRGAQDYLNKGDESVQLLRALRFALERKRRLHVEHELQAARKIQQRMLPQRAPVFEGFDIAGAMFPALETSGDYYDFIIPMPAVGEKTVGIAVGDVSGHGLGPAMVMAETRACLRAFALSVADVGEILRLTNEVLVRSRSQHFVTMQFGYIDEPSRAFRYASAGHRGYKISDSGEIEMLDSTGLVLGLKRSASYELAPDVPLALGDVLLLSTDGLQEAFSKTGEMFGIQRVLDYIGLHREHPAAEIVSGLHSSVREFSDGRPQADDMTAVLIKVNE